MELSIGIALLAGMASFLSPCILPLVPAYTSYFGVISIRGERQGRDYLNMLLNGVAFVVGFSLIFILLGVGISYLSGYLYGLKEALSRVGGVIIILFGIHYSGIKRLSFLDYEKHLFRIKPAKGKIISSFLMGIFFSAGWSPCIGPVLGSILSVAMVNSSVYYGLILMVAYSIGLGIPFLVFSLGIEWLSGYIRKTAKISRYVEVITGVTMILIGGLLLTGFYQNFSRMLGGI